MRDGALTDAPARDTVLRLLTEALSRKLRQAGNPAARVDEGTKLLEIGIIDSQGLIDIILEVEEGSGRAFDPTRLDLERGVTLGMLANAFAEGA